MSTRPPPPEPSDDARTSAALPNARGAGAEPEIPWWSPRVDAALADIARRVRLLGAVTPIEAARERQRLVAAYEARCEATPSWAYHAQSLDAEREALSQMERALASLGGSPLARAYRERVIELALEAELSTLAGSRALGERARARFACDEETRSAARQLAEEWIRLSAPAEPPIGRSDDPSPGSLLSRMRAEVGRRRLAFEVVVLDGLAPLAATGERTIFVAAGREVSAEDVERTVVHEIEGHALPRARAARQLLGLPRIGTARGFDEQEGYALRIEERRGHLTARRRRQLATRHLAVEAMHDGATFVDTVRRLTGEYDVEPAQAVLAAERAFRGGDGEAAGLGRERVYLETFVRVSRWLEQRPEDEWVLATGQVATHAISSLRPHLRDDRAHGLDDRAAVAL